MQTQIIKDETLKLVDEVWDKRIEELKDDSVMEEDTRKPQLLMASHFL